MDYICMHCTHDLSQRCTLDGATRELIDASVWKILNLDLTPFFQIKHLPVALSVSLKILHNDTFHTFK